MSNKITVGLAGAGWPTWQHLKGYRNVEDVEVSALCDSDPERLERIADEYGVPKRYVSFDEMLDQESLDAVSVCTPNYLHSVMAIKALEKGLHVLCEKPMADSAQGARAMLEASRKAGKALMVAHMLRFKPGMQFLKKLIQDGDLGEVYFVRAWWIRRSGIPGMGGWFTTKAQSGGGALIDIGVHILDLALWLLDFPEPKKALGSFGDRFAYRRKGMMDFGTMDLEKIGTLCDVEDFTVGHVAFDRGRSLSLQCSWASHIKGYEDGIEVWGEEGGAKLKVEENVLEIYKDQESLPVDIRPQLPEINPFDEETRHFIECIRNGTPPLCRPEEGVRTMEVIEMIYGSG